MMSDDEEYKVILSDQVKSMMAADAEMEEAIRDFAAMARQAMHGLSTGQYDSFEDAIESMTGNRPRKVDEDEVPEEITSILNGLLEEEE